MSKIKQLRETYEKERVYSDYKHDLTSRNKNWHKDILTVAILLITVFVLFIDKLWKPKDGIIFDDMFWFKFIIAISVLGIACLLIWFNKRADKQIIKELITQYTRDYTRLTEVLKIFEALENDIRGFSKQAENISTNLQQAPISNLITWDDYKSKEKDAEKVWAFSYSLNWLLKDKCQAVKDILCELKDSRYNTHEYRYILVESNVVKRNAIKKQITTMITDFDNQYNTRIKERFQIKAISKGKLLFPVPNDIVICQNYEEGGKTKSIVVINTFEMTNENNDINSALAYDIQFKDEIQISRVVEWYKEIWKSIKEDE